MLKETIQGHGFESRQTTPGDGNSKSKCPHRNKTLVGRTNKGVQQYQCLDCHSIFAPLKYIYNPIRGAGDVIKSSVSYEVKRVSAKPFTGCGHHLFADSLFRRLISSIFCETNIPQIRDCLTKFHTKTKLYCALNMALYELGGISQNHQAPISLFRSHFIRMEHELSELEKIKDNKAIYSKLQPYLAEANRFYSYAPSRVIDLGDARSLKDATDIKTALREFESSVKSKVGFQSFGDIIRRFLKTKIVDIVALSLFFHNQASDVVLLALFFLDMTNILDFAYELNPSLVRNHKQNMENIEYLWKLFFTGNFKGDSSNQVIEPFQPDLEFRSVDFKHARGLLDRLDFFRINNAFPPSISVNRLCEYALQFISSYQGARL